MEGPRGGFRAPIRAGRRHRTEEGKERVKGPLQGGTTGNGAHSDESVPQYRKQRSAGCQRAETTPFSISWGRSEPDAHKTKPHWPGSRAAERGSISAKKTKETEFQEFQSHGVKK